MEGWMAALDIYSVAEIMDLMMGVIALIIFAGDAGL